MDKLRPVMALSGAISPIGMELLRRLKKEADLIALSRSGGRFYNSRQVVWRPCDLFSLAEASACLKGAETAVYIVHGEKSKASLTQANAADLEAVLADNFARAAKKNGIRKIICLSYPLQGSGRRLSRLHKQALEAEQILGAYGTPVAVIRALPLKRRLTSAAALLLDKLAQAVLEEAVCGSDQSAWQQTDKPLAAEAERPPHVRSIQRMKWESGDAAAFARCYMQWVSSIPLMEADIDERLDCRIWCSFLKRPLLEMAYIAERSSPDFVHMHIKGGLLAKAHSKGRLEFRVIPKTGSLLVAIQDYVPALPWPVYVSTQAVIHVLVMHVFRVYLKIRNGKVCQFGN